MKHYKNINGSALAMVLHIVLLLVGASLLYILQYIQAIVILIVPIVFIVIGNVFILASKWHKIMNGRYTTLGPDSTERKSVFLYKGGYVLIGLGILLSLWKLF